MSKELDDLIEAKGWRKGQSVKLGYDDIDEYANQRVIDELESRLSIVGNNCPHHICAKIQQRIKALKQ